MIVLREAKESYRGVYGLNKGNPTDFIDAFISIFPDIYNAIHHGFKKLQHWWTAKSGNDKGGASETAANAQPSA